jgi:hypothetical protein
MVSFALLLGCAGSEPASTFEETDTPRALIAKPICIPLSSSGAFDAAIRRGAWRDAEVQGYRATELNPWFDVTQELDWQGEVSTYSWNGPGELNDFSAKLTWQWFEGLGRALPLNIQRAYPSDTGRSYDDTYSYDAQGRLTRYQHDLVKSDFDDLAEEYGFDAAGRIATFNLVRSDPILNRSFHVEYNAEGRIALWGEDHFGQTNYVREEFEYDDLGRLVRWRRRTPDAIQEQVSINWTASETAYVYEARGVFGQLLVKLCP